MKPAVKQIEEIADNLDCGLKCYFNYVTGNIISIIDFNENFDVDEELYQEDIDELEENWGDYIEFSKMESYVAFKVMEEFAEQVADHFLQARLFKALNMRKPFQYFKWEIDNSGAYRNLWFKFKRNCYIEYVNQIVEMNKDKLDE